MKKSNYLELSKLEVIENRRKLNQRIRKIREDNIMNIFCNIYKINKCDLNNSKHLEIFNFYVLGKKDIMDIYKYNKVIFKLYKLKVKEKRRKDVINKSKKETLCNKWNEFSDYDKLRWARLMEVCKARPRIPKCSALKEVKELDKDMKL